MISAFLKNLYFYLMNSEWMKITLEGITMWSYKGVNIRLFCRKHEKIYRSQGTWDSFHFLRQHHYHHWLFNVFVTICWRIVRSPRMGSRRVNTVRDKSNLPNKLPRISRSCENARSCRVLAKIERPRVASLRRCLPRDTHTPHEPRSGFSSDLSSPQSRARYFSSLE